MRILLTLGALGFAAYLAPGLVFGITFGLFKLVNLGLHALIGIVGLGREMWAACEK